MNGCWNFKLIANKKRLNDIAVDAFNDDWWRENCARFCCCIARQRLANRSWDFSLTKKARPRLGWTWLEFILSVNFSDSHRKFQTSYNNSKMHCNSLKVHSVERAANLIIHSVPYTWMILSTKINVFVCEYVFFTRCKR